MDLMHWSPILFSPTIELTDLLLTMQSIVILIELTHDFVHPFIHMLIYLRLDSFPHPCLLCWLHSYVCVQLLSLILFHTLDPHVCLLDSCFAYMYSSILLLMPQWVDAFPFLCVDDTTILHRMWPFLCHCWFWFLPSLDSRGYSKSSEYHHGLIWIVHLILASPKHSHVNSY